MVNPIAPPTLGSLYLLLIRRIAHFRSRPYRVTTIDTPQNSIRIVFTYFYERQLAAERRRSTRTVLFPCPSVSLKAWPQSVPLVSLWG